MNVGQRTYGTHSRVVTSSIAKDEASKKGARIRGKWEGMVSQGELCGSLLDSLQRETAASQRLKIV